MLVTCINITFRTAGSNELKLQICLASQELAQIVLKQKCLRGEINAVHNSPEFVYRLCGTYKMFRIESSQGKYFHDIFNLHKNQSHVCASKIYAGACDPPRQRNPLWGQKQSKAFSQINSLNICSPTRCAAVCSTITLAQQV